MARSDDCINAATCSESQQQQPDTSTDASLRDVTGQEDEVLPFLSSGRNSIDVHSESRFRVDTNLKCCTAFTSCRHCIDWWLLIDVVFGQLLALLICTTGLFSKRLAAIGISLPTTQSLLNYLLLGMFYSILHCCRTPMPPQPQSPPLTNKEQLLSFCQRSVVTIADVEANYVAVKAYSLTSFTSVQLLNPATSLPVALLLTFVLLRRKYSAMHFCGGAACIAGLILLVTSDSSSPQRPGLSPYPFAGDLLCILAGALYAVSNVGAETVLVHESTWWRREVLGQTEWLLRLGWGGALVSVVQILSLERREVHQLWALVSTAGESPAFGGTWAITQAAGYSLALFTFYSCAPLLLERRGAVFFNLSLLTTQFWAICIGVLVLGEGESTLHANYLLGFAAIIVGVLIFNLAGALQLQP